MKRRATCFAFVAAFLVSTSIVPRSQALNLSIGPDALKPLTETQAELPDVESLIARAKEAVAKDRPSLKTDLDNLFVALLRSRDIADQYSLLDAIGEIGDIRRSPSPVAVKAYMQKLALLVFPRLPKGIQNYASTSWVRLFPSRKDMDREIGVVAPQSKADEVEGLKVLRSRHLGVSYETLQQAVNTADVELTQALLQAGLRVDMANIESTYEVVWPSLRDACDDQTVSKDELNKVLDLLTARGYPIAYSDSFGNSLLFMAASDCPGTVVAHIADLGAPVDAPDRKGVTPLEMALESDRFDAADALMERGARLTRTAGKRVLFMPAQDSRRADYVKRATQADDSAGK